MANKIFHRTYEIYSFFLNAQKKLGLYALLNLLQDTAWEHATQLGYGYEDSVQRKVFWVLSRQKVTMEKWPLWGDKIEIETWIRPFEKNFFYRDFEIFSQGEKIGEATTTWVLLDAQTRRPTQPVDVSEIHQITAEKRLQLDAGKIELRDDLQTKAQFQVRNSDLDLNHHVNNTKYAQWILDSIPNEWLKAFALHAYEINFLAETRSEDMIAIQMEPERSEPLDEQWVQFQGLRQSDQKAVFSARLQVSSLQTEALHSRGRTSSIST